MPLPKHKPFSQLHPNNLKNFWRHVVIGSSDECWIWFGARTPQGYGDIGTAVDYGQKIHWLAHRIAFYIGTGIDPMDKCVLHRCDTPLCVNWNHLFLGTVSDNNTDRHVKGRSVMPTNRARGFGAHPRAKLTDKAVRIIRTLDQQIPARKVAEMFGVHKNTIVALRRGLSYRHVKCHDSGDTYYLPKE